jgi:hypothetical protein
MDVDKEKQITSSRETQTIRLQPTELLNGRRMSSGRVWLLRRCDLCLCVSECGCLGDETYVHAVSESDCLGDVTYVHAVAESDC